MKTKWGSESWAIYLTGIALLLFGTGNYWSATWLSKWALIVGLGSFTLSVWAAKRTSLWYLPLFLYVNAHLLALSVWPNNPYLGTVDEVTLLAIQKNAFFGLAQVSALIFLFAALTYRALRGTLNLFISIWALGTVAILLQPLHGPHSAPNAGLWFGNPSMGAGLLAAIWPLVFRTLMKTKRPKLYGVFTWLLTLAAIYKTHASIPWGVLGVSTGSMLLSVAFRKGLWVQMISATALLGAGMILIGKHLLGADFWDQNGRFEIWSMGFAWFKEHAHTSVGMGYSTTQVLLPLEQVVTKHFHGDYFLWFHSDWLQLLVEGGWIGMLCIALALGRMLALSARYAPYWGAMMGFLVLALFNYPLRMPIHTFCFVLLCALIEESIRYDRIFSLRPAPSAGTSGLPLA